jgi:hypothetical protein
MNEDRKSKQDVEKAYRCRTASNRAYNEYPGLCLKKIVRPRLLCFDRSPTYSLDIMARNDCSERETYHGKCAPFLNLRNQSKAKIKRFTYPEPMSYIPRLRTTLAFRDPDEGETAKIQALMKICDVVAERILSLLTFKMGNPDSSRA